MPRKRGEIQPGTMRILDSSSDEEEEQKSTVDHGKCTWLDCAFPQTPTDVKCIECSRAFHSYHRDGTPKCPLHYTVKRAGRAKSNRDKLQKEAEQREVRLTKERARAAASEKESEKVAKVTHHAIIPSTIILYSY